MKTIRLLLIVLCILLALSLQSQSLNTDNDTTTQSIYYQKTIINTKRVSVYVYSMYDLYWADENGLSILFTLPTNISKKDRKSKRNKERIKWVMR